MEAIWKSTITIYSPFDPQKAELTDLAYDATNGSSYCSDFTVEQVDPKTEPDFPHEFFEVEE